MSDPCPKCGNPGTFNGYARERFSNGARKLKWRCDHCPKVKTVGILGHELMVPPVWITKEKRSA